MPGNLLMWSDLTLDPSIKVKRGYPNLKVLIADVLLVLEVCNVKPFHRKSWARNLLMWSDFTLGSFKVKQWLIGICEFSFQWIQFASILRYARSTLKLKTSFTNNEYKVKM